MKETSCSKAILINNNPHKRSWEKILDTSETFNIFGG